MIKMKDSEQRNTGKEKQKRNKGYPYKRLGWQRILEENKKNKLKQNDK